MKFIRLTIYVIILLFAVQLASAQFITPEDGVPAGISPPNLAMEAALDYRERARFPAWSQSVPPGQADPVLMKRLPSRQSLPHRDGDQLTVWASGIAFESGQTVTLYAQLEPAADNDDGLPGSRPGNKPGGDWTITGVIAGRNTGNLAEIKYERAGDGIFTATFTLPEFARPAIGQAENIGVFVTAQRPGSDDVKAVGGILYSHPAAELTGRYQDEVVDGDLVIRAQVEVHATGRFHLAGTLHSMDGTPVATGRMAEELEPGRHWMDLAFYGLALSERGLAGPYSLGSIILTTANDIPNALGPVVENAHRTRPYSIAEFHTRSFDRPDLLESAERLERAAAVREANRP